MTEHVNLNVSVYAHSPQNVLNVLLVYLMYV